MNSDIFIENLPLILPLVILELILMVSAIFHVIRHPVYRFGNKFFWLVVVIFIQIIGPIIYFVFGRGDNT